MVGGDVSPLLRPDPVFDDFQDFFRESPNKKAIWAEGASFSVGFGGPGPKIDSFYATRFMYPDLFNYYFNTFRGILSRN